MGTSLGNSGKVKVNGANYVGELVSYQLTEAAATVDDSAIGDAADTHLVGSTNWNASVVAMFDPADAGQSPLTAGAAITIAFYPVGSGSGAGYKSGAATVTQVQKTVARNQRIEVTFTVQGNGALTPGTVS